MGMGMGMGMEMGMAGAVGVRSSSFLADAVRETATNHCIDRVVNGSLDGTVAVVSSVSCGDASKLVDRAAHRAEALKPTATAPKLKNVAVRVAAPR